METERCEQLLKEQHERLTAALEEERGRQEERVEEAIRKAQEQHKVRGGGWEEVDEGSLGGGGGRDREMGCKEVGGGEIGRGESRICQLI